MAASGTDVRNTLSLGHFTGVDVHDVGTSEIEHCTAALFDRGGRTTVLLGRVRDAIARDHSPRLNAAELVDLGLDGISFTWSGDKRGVAVSLWLRTELFSLGVERAVEGAVSLRMNCRAGNSQAFALITAAMKRLGFEKFDIGAEVVPSEPMGYALKDVPRAHRISLGGREIACGC